MMMAFATISDHLDMTGVIELNRCEILAQLVNPHVCRRRCCGRKRRQSGSKSEGSDYDRNEHFDLHNINLSLSTLKRLTDPPPWQICEQQSETTLIPLALVNETIKDRKDDEECQANQIFQAFDVLIVIDDREDLADLADRGE
jgi:hypothetical protein